MRIPDQMIFPVIMLPPEEVCAFEQMRRLYQSFNDPKVKFWEDFFHYSEHGYVRISPTAMAFAKPCRDKDGEYWFIRAAVGPILELLAMLPSYLPRIMWCRNNEPTLRIYKTERLFKIAVAQMKKGK